MGLAMRHNALGPAKRHNKAIAPYTASASLNLCPGGDNRRQSTALVVSRLYISLPVLRH
jgi:hypothetical protein